MADIEKHQDEQSTPSLHSSEGPLHTPESLARHAQGGENTVRAGRFVLDPAEARIEYGDKITDELKKTPDGSVILWPQPTSDPEDPQNWSNTRKTMTLICTIITAFQPDFQAGIGSSAIIFQEAAEWNRSTTSVVNTTVNFSILSIGLGGLFWVVVARRFGRLPVTWWSQFLAFCFSWGLIFAPSIGANAALRILAALCASSSQVLGIYIVADMYPFHLFARKLNLWTAGIGPFLADWIIAANANWRWSYGMCVIFQFISLCGIAFVMEETMYDRHLWPNVPARQSSGVRYRIETLLGVTGWRNAKYRTSLARATWDLIDTAWRPHLLLPCLYCGIAFGFSIGNNATLATFTGQPVAAGGYGLDAIAVAAFAATPIVATIIGEILGRYLNEFIQTFCTRRNHGVFEAEMRFWVFYIAMPLIVLSECIIGVSLQDHLNVGALIMGYGIAQAAVMINTTAGYAYLGDCFPTRAGEASAWLNFYRIISGFAIPYFQLEWAVNKGALQTFGCEGAIVAGLFILIVPFLQIKGASIRTKYSVW